MGQSFKGKKYSMGLVVKFMILSLVGIFMFFVPLKVDGATTIPIEFAVGFLIGHLKPIGRTYALIVILIASVLPFVKKTWKKDLTTAVFAFTKIVGAVFAILVFFNIGPEAVIL